jgi:hypothetical protein
MGDQRGQATHGKAVNFGFDKADRAVTVADGYVLDADFGPGFIKRCSSFPPSQGVAQRHEWAKRQAATPVWPSPSWPTALPPASSPSGSGRSATSSAPPSSGASSTTGSPSSPPPHRHRPCGRLLVGAVHAPGRGRPEDRL